MEAKAIDEALDLFQVLMATRLLNTAQQTGRRDQQPPAPARLVRHRPGPAPPARNTDRWLECATRVLLYRLTYRVTDQVLALGTRPDPEDEHRHGWWEELRTALRPW
ncbi:hypothetical protein AB0N00_34220 [Streptomyces anulatus]